MSPVAIKIINNTQNASITIGQYQQIVNDKYDHAQKYIQILYENNIQYVTFEDQKYPTFLKKDIQSPAIIFYQGNLDLLKLKPIAIVGSRELDLYSQQIIADSIPRINVPIISGMAYGIDINAHQIALKNNKKCIAVLPCGILENVFYPKQNYKYKDQIINNGGLIVSQLLPDTKPLRYTFILRNRFIAQLANQIWIVKAALKSGTLSTANYALELNKKLLVTTYNQYDEGYKGNYELISKGAKPLISSDYFGIKVESNNYTDNQKLIIKLIKSGINNIDSISDNMDYNLALKTILSLQKTKTIIEQDGLYQLLDN